MGTDRRDDRKYGMGADAVNPAVISLIADYLVAPEITAQGLLTHLRINGWTVVPIAFKEQTWAEPEDDE